ncbi:MAG: DEAD/DEAH box helicase family protein [Spirochaetes bacterium]|nr:DEAD/DEAH box helicase family protein [Spirochaetota bacterium]
MVDILCCFVIKSKKMTGEKNFIKELLGSTIFRRAVSYYKNGMVINSYSESGRINAVVRGSGGNRYTVEILFNSNGDFEEAHCSCPYPYYCKHIGAVLLKFIDDKTIYPGIGEYQVELSLTKESDEDYKKEDKIIPLKDDGRINRDIFNGLINLPFSENKDKTKNNTRFRLVFTIENMQTGFFFGEQHSPWGLKPELQYIKKNGTPGRLENYNPDKLTEPITEEEKIILSILNKNEDKQALFDYYIDYFVSNPSLELFIKKQRALRNVSFAAIEKTVIKFKLLGLREEDPVFNLFFEFSDNKGHITTITPPYRTASASTTFFIVNEKQDIILYSRKNLLYRNIISNMLSVKQEYSYSDILKLNDFFKKNFPGLMEIEFPARQIRIVYKRPKPIIELEYEYPGLRLNLIFKYGKRTAAYKEKYQFLILDSGEKEIVTANRDKDYETKCILFLNSYLSADIIKTTKASDRHASDTFVISKNMDEFLLERGEKLISEGFELRRKGKKIRKASNLVFTAQWNIDWLDIKTEIEVDGGEVLSVNPGSDIIEGLFLKKDDSYFLLRKSDIEKLKELYRHGEQKQDRVQVSKYNFVVIDEIYKDLKNKKDKELIRTKKIIDGLKNFKGIKKVRLPNSFKGTLRNYQQAGLNWLYFLNEYKLNGILADDMGLGKTVQALALLLVLKNKNKLKRALITAPVSTLSNWMEEIKRFTPGLAVYMHHGLLRLKGRNRIMESDITVTSYHTLRNDIELFKKIPFTYFILDEAQTAKNPLSKIYKSINLIDTENKLSLTGTPVENSTIDLWAQMNFLNPGILGNLSDFKRKFSKPIEKGNNTGQNALLKKMIFPFILRRKKETVLKDLPPKEEIILYATMDTDQSRVYREIREYYREKVNKKIKDEGLNKSSICIFEALLKLRQAAILPGMVSGRYKDTPSCKLDLLKLKVTELLSENHKALIFSQFLDSLSAIRKWIQSLKIDYTYLDGSTKDREFQIRSFQENKKKRVFIISLKAGGLGINLTASDYVILFDPWWNPAVEMQAVDRSHRIGQKNKVTIYKFITKDTVEEKILKLQERKSRLVKDIITTEKSFFKSLDRSEIMNLFE